MLFSRTYRGGAMRVPGAAAGGGALHELGADERRYIERLFQNFDTDKSGKIDFLEFKILARKLGVEMSDSELRRSIQAIPRASLSEELDFGEFLYWLQSAQSEGSDPFSVLKVKIKAQGKKTITNCQIEGLKECFAHFDRDNSGSIDVNELGEVFRAFGAELPKEELDAMIREVDSSGNGQMEFDEFLMLMINNFGEEASAEQELVEEFQKRDEARSGRITAAELKALMAGLCGEYLPEEEIDTIVGSLDFTPDGLVEYMKWEEIWEALRE